MVNVASVRRQLANSINPDKAAQPKRRVRSKTAEFTAFTKRIKDRELKKKLYTIYENGGEVAEAVDVYALFVVSNKPKIMADIEDDKEKLDAWWDKMDGPTFLFDAVRWALVFGESVFEKVPNMIHTKTVKLKYIDGRSTELIIDDFGELESVLQYYDAWDNPITFDPQNIIKICILTAADGVTGISLINRAMDNITRSVKVSEGISSYVERHGFPKYQIKITSLQEGMAVPKEVLDEAEKVFENINSKNEFVTDDKTEILPLDKEGKGAIKEANEWGTTQISSSLGVPEDLLGLNRGNTKATMRMRAFELKAGSIRHRLNKQVQLQLFESLREQLGLSMDGKLWIEFPDINPKDEEAKAKWISQLMPNLNITSGEITAEEIDDLSVMTQDEVREQMGLGKKPEKKKGELSTKGLMEKVRKEITKEMLAAINEQPEMTRQNRNAGKARGTSKTIIKKMESGLFEVTEVGDES